jgi:hypothetical protein
MDDQPFVAQSLDGFSKGSAANPQSAHQNAFVDQRTGLDLQCHQQLLEPVVRDICLARRDVRLRALSDSHLHCLLETR